jgi:DNA-binding CsgD family transcriptional regulator/PAS domain-containing protein
MSATFSRTTRRLHQLATKLQGALSVAEVETAYLESVPSLSFARAHGLYRLEPRTERVLGVASDAHESFLEEYECDGRHDDPVFAFVRERLRPVDSSRAARPEVWERSAARRVLDKAGYFHSLEAPVVAAGVVCGTINFARTAEDPPFDVADLCIARRIGEQVGLAMERAARFEEAQSRADMLEESVNRMAHAVVVTDLDANILFTNRAAARADGRDQKALVALAGEEIARTVGMIRDDNRRVATGLVKDTDSGQRLVVRSVLLAKVNLSLSLIQLCRDDEEFKMPVWDVLSPREQEIARLVAQGLTTKQIAEQAFVSENTVKMHLKRIFAKTDIRNRAELVQRIWRDGKTGPDQDIS